ncbi:hypothetical protein NDU88_004719, partial [Pleurodeles waltl]
VTASTVEPTPFSEGQARGKTGDPKTVLEGLRPGLMNTAKGVMGDKMGGYIEPEEPEKTEAPEETDGTTIVGNAMYEETTQEMLPISFAGADRSLTEKMSPGGSSHSDSSNSDSANSEAQNSDSFNVDPTNTDLLPLNEETPSGDNASGAEAAAVDVLLFVVMLRTLSAEVMMHVVLMLHQLMSCDNASGAEAAAVDVLLFVVMLHTLSAEVIMLVVLMLQQLMSCCLLCFYKVLLEKCQKSRLNLKKVSAPRPLVADSLSTDHRRMMP